VAGRYELLGRLGAGGMGTVWRAHDVVLGREVAVKEIVFPHGLPDDEREVLRERTRREARAAARLDHPSAVTVYDVVEEDGSPFLVMELVEARTLAEVVRSDGPLTPAHAATMGLAVLGALEAAHKQGIVHRDVKPGNVLLTRGADGAPSRVVLTDFGIATSSGDSSITSTGLILGSPAYIAPERCRGQSPGPPSDLWSLGASLFTAVEGRPPYDGGDPLATVTAVVTGEHAPFVAAGPLQPVIEGLLERDPEQRLDAAGARRLLKAVAAEAQPTAAIAPAPDVAGGRRADRTAALPIGAVQEAARGEAPPPPPVPVAQAAAPVAPSRPAPPPRPPRPAVEPRRRSPALPLVLAALLLVAAVAGGVALLSGAGDDDDPLAAPRDPGASAPASPESEPEGEGEPADDEPEPSASAEATPSTPAGVQPPPEGWQQFTGGPGWTVAVPPGYTPGDFEGQPQYRDAGQPAHAPRHDHRGGRRRRRRRAGPARPGGVVRHAAPDLPGDRHLAGRLPGLRGGRLGVHLRERRRPSARHQPGLRRRRPRLLAVLPDAAVRRPRRRPPGVRADGSVVRAGHLRPDSQPPHRSRRARMHRRR
jgi:hypothetical protein